MYRLGAIRAEISVRLPIQLWIQTEKRGSAAHLRPRLQLESPWYVLSLMFRVSHCSSHVILVVMSFNAEEKDTNLEIFEYTYMYTMNDTQTMMSTTNNVNDFDL